jgi:hypothetical protein
LDIVSADRVAGASSKPITPTFRTSAIHPAGSTITMSYPPAFFAQGISATSITSAGFQFTSMLLFSTTSITITLGGTPINATYSIKFTIHGVTIGARLGV